MEKLVHLSEDMFLNIINQWWQDTEPRVYGQTRHFPSFQCDLDEILLGTEIELIYNAQNDTWVIK